MKWSVTLNGQLGVCKQISVRRREREIKVRKVRCRHNPEGNRIEKLEIEPICRRKGKMSIKKTKSYYGEQGERESYHEKHRR